MTYRRSFISGVFGRLLMVFVAMTLVTTAVAPAAAQESDAKKILTLIGSANDKFEKEDFEGAYSDYQDAFELYPDPSLLYRLGLTSEKLNQPMDAITYYEKFIDAVPDDKTAKKVKARLDELKTTAPGRLVIESTPPGASVFIGSLESQSVGETPLEVDVAAGDVSVYVVLEGHETSLRNLKLANATIETLTFDLDKEIALADVDPDEKSSGSSSGLSTWGWVLTGTGVAMLGTGGVFSFLSQGKTDDVNSYDKQAPSASPGELQELKDSADAFYSTSLGLYIAGGVVAATGLTFLILDGLDSEGQTSLKLDVVPSPNSAWVGLSGTF